MHTDLLVVRVVLIGLAMLGSALFFIVGCYDLHRSIEAANWTVVPGSVLEKESSDLGLVHPRPPQGVSAAIQYRYKVEDKVYTGTKVGFGIGRADDSILVGDYIDVYVDPHDSRVSVIETGLSIGHFITLLWSLACGFLASYFKKILK